VKLPAFSYHRAESIEHAIALLRQYDGEARIIAGGQSLLPMMAYRLVKPAALIDIGRIGHLAAIRLGDTGLSIGSLTRWCDIQSSAEIRGHHPLLHDAIGYVAHYQIRNRGTIGGSLAHCDPAAECPAVVLACQGHIVVQGSRGTRSVRAGDFLQGLLSTALEPDEVITSIELPCWKPGRFWAFKEFSRRTGDFALAGVAVHFEMVDNCVSAPSIVGFGVGDRALVLPSTEKALEFKPIEPEIIARAVSVAREEIDPPLDPYAPPDYRRALFGVLLERALKQAVQRNREFVS
jgi:carbon-monoxide dehydrogenase medium subunit